MKENAWLDVVLPVVVPLLMVVGCIVGLATC